MRAPARTPRPRGLPSLWASTGPLKLLDRVDRIDESHIVTSQRAAHEPKWSWAAECPSRDPHSGKCQHAPTRAHRGRMGRATALAVIDSQRAYAAADRHWRNANR